MGAVKRKEAPSSATKVVKKQKTVEAKKSKLDAAAEQDGDFSGFEEEDEQYSVRSGPNVDSSKKTGGKANFKLETSSAEAHAKQRQLARERKAAKPNADAIERSKKLWERLRRKSHVAVDERKKLVAELFEIITGRVRDFVFKHDSVRVVQCALKYANAAQRRMIVEELCEDIRALAESRYGKFLVAKMVVEGDQEIRNMVVPQFYGHVKRLINHPEAGWIVDDIYRQIATSQQKAIMLREWYGTEFALANRELVKANKKDTKDITADLPLILAISPEKRKPIHDHLLPLINSLLQKKLTGYTLLHDAMLQYYLSLTPGSEDFIAFLDLLKADIETKAEAQDSPDINGGGDLFRNLAFTASGSRLVCYALAQGNAKDRKVILRCFKSHVEIMAFDSHAKMVLLAGLEVTDDTRMTGKGIVHELLGLGIEDEEQRFERLQGLLSHLHARVPILYPLVSAGESENATKWLLPAPVDQNLLKEIIAIRTKTSKKAPEIRRKELLEHLSAPLLSLAAGRAEVLVQSSFGCQALSEMLLYCNTAPDKSDNLRIRAAQAVSALASGDPADEMHIAHNPAAGRMLKTLVLGGPFDPRTKSVKLVEPHLQFAEQGGLWEKIREMAVKWAVGPSSFVIVALLESEDVSDAVKDDVRKALRKGKTELEKAAANGKQEGEKGNAGARILLKLLQ